MQNKVLTFTLTGDANIGHRLLNNCINPLLDGYLNNLIINAYLPYSLLDIFEDQKVRTNCIKHLYFGEGISKEDNYLLGEKIFHLINLRTSIDWIFLFKNVSQEHPSFFSKRERRKIKQAIEIMTKELLEIKYHSVLYLFNNITSYNSVVLKKRFLFNKREILIDLKFLSNYNHNLREYYSINCSELRLLDITNLKIEEIRELIQLELNEKYNHI